MRSRPQSASRRPRGAAPGFTLIEAALATVIIGVGILAMVDAQQSFIRTNNWSSHAASGTYLANELREIIRSLPRHDPTVGLTLTDSGGGGGATLSGWGPNAGEQVLADFDDVDDFDGITFGYDGTPDPSDGDLPGPVNAFREVIPELTVDGVEETNGGVPVPMTGWRQTVIVEKVDPFDTSITLDDAYVEPPSGSFPGRAVDKFPLRVTVVTTYQAPGAIEPDEVARVIWIMP
ncbi:MAG: hypothetical protein R3B57_04555 [Phycisphaerales bacterium]